MASLIKFSNLLSSIYASANTPSTLVYRDVNGDFSARTLTLSGNISVTGSVGGAGATFTGTSFTGSLIGTANNALSLGGALANTYASLASPTFTGVPQGPTAVLGTSTTQLATTAFVTTGLSAFTGTANIATVGNISAGTWNGTTIAITKGGTGATSAAQALTNLLPTGTTAGYVLKTSGPGSFYWAAETGASAIVGTRIDSQRLSYTATAGQTVFTAPTYTVGASQLRVYVNGVRQFASEYVETNATTVTFNAPGLIAGDLVLIEVDGYINYQQTAAAVSFAPVGTILSTDVQSAIASLETNKIALTALGTTTPLANGTATPGVSTSVARADHVHPGSATAADLTGAAFTGPVSAPSYGNTIQTIAYAATPTAWNPALGTTAKLTFGAGNITSFANPTSLINGAVYNLILVQDATGSRTITAWGTAYKFPGGVKPVLSTAANAIDVITFLCDGVNLYGSYVRGMA